MTRRLFALLAAQLFIIGRASISSASSNISWTNCDGAFADNATASCGFLEVPLDYHNSSAGTARLALVKVNAISDRIGTVLFNPGGPGDSGIDSLSVENFTLTQDLIDRTGGRYDIVSWDPRGVGNRTVPGSVLCGYTYEEYLSFFNGTVQLSGINMIGNFTDPEDISTLLSEAAILQDKYDEAVRKCIDLNGDVLRYIGTAATARDMVSIFDSIEGPDSAINFIGASYGTMLGAWFVNMFPDRVGRIILDGVLDPTLIATSELATSWQSRLTLDADTVYKGFTTGCALAGPSGCALASSVGDNATAVDIDAKIQAILKTAHDAEIANKSSTPLTSGQIRLGLYNAPMYSPTAWKTFANIIIPQMAEAVEGEASMNETAVELAELLAQIILSGFGELANSDNVSFSLHGILCGDTPDPDPTTNMTTVFKSVISASRTVSHMFGAAWPHGSAMCAAWPVRSVERYTGPFNRPLANKIMIASTLFDPVTPLATARLLAELMADQATFVRTNGFGHSTLAEPSQCFLNVSRAYMINGTLPDDNDTACDIDVDFEVFPGVNTQAILEEMLA